MSRLLFFFFFLFVVFFKCLNATIPLTCTLANEYPSNNEINKKNSTVRGDCIVCHAFFSHYFSFLILIYFYIYFYSSMNL